MIAFVNTRHMPARLPPVTAHPTPSSQVTLASSLRASRVSSLVTIFFSRALHAPKTFLKNPITAFGFAGREGRSSIVGEGRGEYDARDASRLAKREDAMNVDVVTRTSTAKYDSQDGLDQRVLSLKDIQHRPPGVRRCNLPIDRQGLLQAVINAREDQDQNHAEHDHSRAIDI